MPIAEFACPTPQALYENVRNVRWRDWMTVDTTFAVDCNCRDSQISHSHYAALKVKDAIVDQFRDDIGRRPNVDRRQPMLQVNAHIVKDRCVLSLDASGDRLHRRGYRRQATDAPLRETLAAAIVGLVDWDNEGMFIDPMCGSGTIVIEAGAQSDELRARTLALREQRFGAARFRFPAMAEF